jgi:hypothetical protein
MIAKIEFTKPSDASVEDIASFIHDALTSWGGGLHPEDPMFRSLELKTVTVHGKKFQVPEPTP